ncbi:hypothetical protein L1987_00308 [Smallanthus sonchifolius]|uniref:Uncharacterized protein n=1 Tax=Smallanthus sonchifolius TaxID=185202 RepID=A0ACB9K1Y8_9ASTR|nr:hypothetical protein L1987_00308 [Smallanthus sonchifolius]
MGLEAEPSFKLPKMKFAIGCQDSKSKNGRTKKHHPKKAIQTVVVGLKTEPIVTGGQQEAVGVSGRDPMVEKPDVGVSGRDPMVGKPVVSDLDPVSNAYAAEREKKAKREEEKKQ